MATDHIIYEVITDFIQGTGKRPHKQMQSPGSNFQCSPVDTQEPCWLLEQEFFHPQL